MKRIEQFLVMLAALSLTMFWLGDRKTAGLLMISLTALAAFYLIGSVFLLRRKDAVKLPQVIGLVICGAVFCYALLCILKYAIHKISGTEMLTDNGIFLGTTIAAALLDYALTKRRIGIRILVRAMPLLAIIILMCLFFRH